MELKPGYRQTEVGVIPEEWEVKNLAKVAPLQRGFDLPNSLLIAGTHPVVYSNGIMNYHVKAMVKRPGVVTGRSGTIGKVHYVESDFWPHNTTLWVTDFFDNSPLFVFFLYTFIGFDRFASGSGVPTLNRNDAHAFQVPLPPTKAEQKAIAEALTDADALIESLEQLIAKKRLVKQGAMQELLTGKSRVPGFELKPGYKQTEVGVIPEDWVKTLFGEISKQIVGGGTPSRSVPSYWNGNVPWMTVKDFAKHSPLGTLEYITKVGLNNSASHLIPKNTLITSTRMALGKAVIFKVDVSINQDLKAIFPTNDIDTRFLYFWFQFNEAHIAEMGSGSTVMGLSLTDLRNIPFVKPPLSEQKAIATILSDMDVEIEVLQAKMIKARQVKQGMMQELLTGRTRLL